jgi:aspartate kinase
MKRVERDLEEIYPNADLSVRALAIASVFGRDMRGLRVLTRGLEALETAEIEVEALHQTTRSVDVQFVVGRDDRDRAIKALHDAVVAAPPSAKETQAAA